MDAMVTVAPLAMFSVPVLELPAPMKVDAAVDQDDPGPVTVRVELTLAIRPM
jgi:hypothetical protein